MGEHPVYINCVVVPEQRLLPQQEPDQRREDPRQSTCQKTQAQSLEALVIGFFLDLHKSKNLSRFFIKKISLFYLKISLFFEKKRYNVFFPRKFRCFYKNI